MRSPFLELIQAAGEVFDSLGIEWYLFGAQAALVHGATRLTADVDLTVALGEQETALLVEALGQRGFSMRVDDEEFIERTRVLPVVHRDTNVPADIVLAGPGIEEQFLARAEMRDLGGLQVPVACAEDVVAMKILAGRPKDLDDAVAVLAAQADSLDLTLVRSTLALLERALDQSDLLPALDEALAPSSS
jgi:hypothetical protein